MEKKFTKRLMLMGLCSTAVTLALCVLVFFTVFERQAAQDVRIYSDIITAAYYQNGHSLSDMGVGSSDLRVTLIQPDGTVLFDNAVSGNLETIWGVRKSATRWLMGKATPNAIPIPPARTPIIMLCAWMTEISCA